MTVATINKTMAIEDVFSNEAQPIIAELNALISHLRANDLKVSSWYGAFDLTGTASSFERINRGYDYTPVHGAAWACQVGSRGKIG